MHYFPHKRALYSPMTVTVSTITVPNQSLSTQIAGIVHAAHELGKSVMVLKSPGGFDFVATRSISGVPFSLGSITDDTTPEDIPDAIVVWDAASWQFSRDSIVSVLDSKTDKDIAITVVELEILPFQK